MKGTKIVVLAAPSERDIHSVADIKGDLNRWMSLASNFKKAYELALYLGEVKEPNLSYRQALNIFKENEAVMIDEKSSWNGDELEGKVIISKLNLY